MDKRTQKVMFSSKRGDHQTPIDLYKQLDDEFHFTTDVAASKDNALHENFLSEEYSSAFEYTWGKINYCNPPYGIIIRKWVARAAEMHTLLGKATIMLLPARTETKWFHSEGAAKADQIRFIKGRLKFQGEKDVAPFPSLLMIWHGRQLNRTSHPGTLTENSKYKWKVWYPKARIIG